jgi:hypothetical protein
MTFWSNTSPTTYNKCESGVSIIQASMVFQCIDFFKSRYHLLLNRLNTFSRCMISMPATCSKTTNIVVVQLLETTLYLETLRQWWQCADQRSSSRLQITRKNWFVRFNLPLLSCRGADRRRKFGGLYVPVTAASQIFFL